MFSSSFLTADIPPSSQAKAESAKASSAMLGEEGAASQEEGRFAKELQAVAGDEQNLKADQQVTPVAQAKLEVSEALPEDIEPELQQSDTEASQSVGKKIIDAKSGEQEVSNLRISQDEVKTEVSASQTTDQQNGQISASQQLDVSSELDSVSKQQIMDDGEALLNRLSESNKQLSETQAVAADMQKAGKLLPQAAQVDGEVAVDAVNTQEKALSGVSVHQGNSPDNIIETDSMTQVKAPVAGISQEELAKVFAVSGLKTVEGQATDQVSSDVSEQGEQDADVTGEGAMTALGLGAAVPAAGAEVKSVQPTPQTSADLLQSANPRTAELTKEQQASPELLDGKNKSSNALTPNAAATAATFTAANSQPLLSSEVGQGAALNFGNPALMSAATGSAEAQLSGAAGAAAGAAAGVAAGAGALVMELGTNENGSDGKSAELTHTLAGPATLQGQANAQARAEAALAQSPLQLSKEQAGDQLAERVQVMMSKNLKHVDIRLDPPELGKLQIKLSLNQDQASVQFTVGNQQTRDLVEQAMPRLRELLNQQGLQLAQTSVQQDSSRQQFAGQQNQQQNQTNAGQQNNSGGQPGNGDSRHQHTEPGGSEPVDMYVSQPSDRVDYYA